MASSHDAVQSAPPTHGVRAAPKDDGPRRDSLIQWGIFLGTVAFVAVPLLPLLYQAFLNRPVYEGGALTLANFAKLVSLPELREVVFNTFAFGLLSTLVATMFGLFTALLVGRTDVPGRSVFANILLWPLYISHLVLAFGWISIYGPSGFITGVVEGTIGATPWNLYTLPGLSLVAGLSLAPLTYLYCISSVNMQDASLENAARVVGAGPLRILLTVSVPLLRPALLYSAVMAFVVAIEMLAIPLALGAPVGLKFFTSFLYERAFESADKDYGLVSAAAVVMLGFITLVLVWQQRLLRNSGRFVTVGGKATRPRTLSLGRWRWPACAFLSAYFLFGTGVVVVGLVLRAFTSFLSPMIPPWEVMTFDNIAFVFSSATYVRSIVNTLVIALVGGAAGTVLVTLIVFVAHRSTFRYRAVLEFAALYPRAVPGVLMGLGAFYALALLPGAGMLRNTIWVLMVVYIVRYIPAAFGVIAPVTMQVARDLDRSARTVGADWWTTCTRILFGLVRPAMISAFAVLFLHFLKEYATAAFLFSPGSEVMGTTMLGFWIQGDTGPVAALAVLQILITAVFVIALRKLFGVKIYG